MEKNVVITIESSQVMDGRKSVSPELVTQGTYSMDADTIRFAYMESKLTGMEGTETSFTVKPDQVVLSREGSVNSSMVFIKGETHTFLYGTEFGVLTLGLSTHRIEHDLGEHGGNMEIEYDLNFEKAFVSRNKFKINVREMKS